MPQYNSPTLGTATSIAAADLVLFWVTALAGNKLITAQNLADCLQALMDFDDEVTELVADTTLSDEEFAVANSGSSLTFTIPLAVDNPGKSYRIANKGTGLLIIMRSGSDSIYGNTFVTLAQYESCVIESDAVDTWFRFN